MAQYVHGTSVQQCVLDQLSGASVAQSTQHVMYHLLIHCNPWHPQTQLQYSCLPLSLIAPPPIHQTQPPQLPTAASSPSIWAHAAVPAASLEGIDHVHLDLQEIWKVNFGRRLFMPWLRMQVCTTPLKKVVPSSASKECQVVSSSAKHRYQSLSWWHTIGTNLQIPGWRPKPHVT